MDLLLEGASGQTSRIVVVTLVRILISSANCDSRPIQTSLACKYNRSLDFYLSQNFFCSSKKIKELNFDKEPLSYEEMRRRGRENTKKGNTVNSFYNSYYDHMATGMNIMGSLNKGEYTYVPRSGPLNPMFMPTTSTISSSHRANSTYRN